MVRVFHPSIVRHPPKDIVRPSTDYVKWDIAIFPFDAIRHSTYNPCMTDIGKRIRQFRDAAGLSQSGLAEKAGIPIRSVQNWEQGHRLPSVKHLLPLATALGISIDALFAPTPPADAPKPRRK